MAAEKRKRTRRYILIGTAAALALFLVYAFWPRPVMVDMAEVRREAMIITIDEEARTRVRDEYIVAAPVAGRLLRVGVEAGDRVEENDTVLARMAPSDPSFLDERVRAEAEAAVEAAEAALSLAEAERSRARADESLAGAEAERVRALAEAETAPRARLERAERDLAAARAARQSAEAGVRMRRAELVSARARLAVAPDGEGAGAGLAIRSPISGRVLQIHQRSETVIAPGAPIVSVGDPRNDLEILTELLSRDAVRVRPGARALIEDWGGQGSLRGVVRRVEPFGFTKISALGVEEQRVNVVIDFEEGQAARADGLGHGYRVDVRIVVWEDENALVAPASALFRQNGQWAVYAVENGRARLRVVEVGGNNGLQAQILSGLEAGDVVIEYPGDRLADGVSVSQRGEGG